MPTLNEARAKVRELSTKALAAVDSTSMTSTQKKAVLDQVEPAIKHWTDEVRALESVEQRKSTMFGQIGEPGSSLGSGDDAVFDTTARPSKLITQLAAKGYRQIAPPVLELAQDQAQELYESAVSRKSLRIHVKDVSSATGSGSVGEAAIANIRPMPVLVRREPTRVLSLLPVVASAAAQETWYKQTTAATNAGPVPEGGLKPSTTVAFAPQTVKPTKLAVYSEVTDETLEDWSAFLGVLQSELAAAVYVAENNELLNGVAGASNAGGDPGASQWNGLLNTSGILTRTHITDGLSGDNNLDTVERAITDLRAGSSYAEPTGIVMHPRTFAVCRLTKNSQGVYLMGGPADARTNDPTLWGVPVVLTTAIAAGTALVGAFDESVAVYMRQTIRLDLNGQGEAQFKHNTQLARAEERLSLTVPRPTGLVKVTALATT